ncbi:hypothetical protein DAX96_25270 [Salmonella enterica subsp. enterica]|nr:hypothetical protein A7T36_24175 [Salmonella enterica subsp. enterica serovar Muenchen]PUF41099.1 hypothetical protein DAX96_25270 [Salmonella enterica subsp. enterica]OHL88512.1 hypothetical protein A7T13_15035 [Salmonella enterica subsp. enterica serovar Muenchen]OHN06576.1 hypothetical protein A7T51_17370 [Salmonella enterica subsp. enterica serovar Muenchen]OHN54441.1 hypothetical protein A7T68_21295 [Salmonella enterica subsp. enterica serovar Muenchen]
MPNSEVKRRSADGSVGSPHARVGNCQASNKTKGPVGRQGLLFLSVSAGWRLHLIRPTGIIPPTKLVFL